MIKGSAYDPLKRVLDISAASFLLVLTAPVQIGIALLVRTRMGTPVLFRQERPGKNGVTFELRKFRTMRNEVEGEDVSPHSRVTKLGRRLRSTSLDELPTLWNVLRGDMSLVGPRPLLVEYLPRYDAHQARRHEVRPGITGLAQVSGRNSISWEEKFELDVVYVDSRSLGVDIKILLATLTSVLARRGIDAGKDVTMPKFLGSSRGA